MRTLVAAGALCSVVMTAPFAHADAPTKRECIDANAAGQSQTKEGKLRAARSSLRLCASSACPAAVRDDCALRLDDLERLIPSLVFEAKDASGQDLKLVRVKVDGRPLADNLDGTALSVDPGEHTFTFEVVGYTPVTRTLLLREGDRARRERVILVPAGTEPPATKEAPAEGNGQRVLGIVLGSAGIVGLGVGGVLGGLASSTWSSAKSCVSATATDCANREQAMADHDSAVALATGSTIGFIAGGALLVTGVIVFLTAPKHATTATARFVPGLGPGARTAVIMGTF